MGDLLNINTMIYIFSLSFQLAGAILLIIKYFGKTKNRIIEEYFPGSNIIERDEKNICRMERDKVRESVRKVYDNRMSFIFIAVGYILSIFENKSYLSKVYIALFVILGALIIILIEKGICLLVSKMFYKNDIEIPYDELAYIADTTISEEEIDNMSNDL